MVKKNITHLNFYESIIDTTINNRSNLSDKKINNNNE